jgi:hypothetical protein
MKYLELNEYDISNIVIFELRVEAEESTCDVFEVFVRCLEGDYAR